MGNAAAVDDQGLGVGAMMQRLEELQLQRERIDARFEELERQDNALLERGKQIVVECEQLEQRRIALDDEIVQIDARRETLEDEQQALVTTRDTLDRTYTELYAQLDHVADEVAPPSATPPPLTDFVVAGTPLARPAPWRTTLVVVPDPATPSPIPTLPTPTWWQRSRAGLAVVASTLAVVIGVVALWPEDPPPEPTPVDPQAALDLVRAAFVPAPTDADADADADAHADANADANANANANANADAVAKPVVRAKRSVKKKKKKRTSTK